MGAASEHRVVLTGASGTLGRNFLAAIAADPKVHVLALLRDDSRQPPPQERLDCTRVDFNDALTMSRVIERFRPTCLIHCAASGMSFPRARWFSLIRFNVDVSINLCQCVSTLPGCHFIYVSTGLAYREQGRPLRESDPLDTLHPYGASKAAADILVRAAAAEFGVPITVLRPFSFTGPGDDQSRLFPTILRCAAEGVPVELSPCDQVRDHSSARDIAAGIAAAMFATNPQVSDQRVYNLGGGDRAPLRAVIERVVAELALDVELAFGARNYARHEPMDLSADLAFVKTELSWAPTRNLAHSVWELARESFPALQVTEPCAHD